MIRVIVCCLLLAGLASAQTDEAPPDPLQTPGVDPVMMTQVTFRTIRESIPTVSAFPSSLRRSRKPWVCAGLGHFDLGEPVKGRVLVGTFGASLIVSLTFELTALSAYQDHLDLSAEALSETDYGMRERKMKQALRQYDRANSLQSWAQAALVGAGIVWAYGLFDYHYILSRSGTGWAVVPGPKGVDLCLRKSF
jgi:hypothetical protein